MIFLGLMLSLFAILLAVLLIAALWIIRRFRKNALSLRPYAKLEPRQRLIRQLWLMPLVIGIGIGCSILLSRRETISEFFCQEFNHQFRQ